MEELTGIHHVTAITSSAEKIYDFFTHVLGLRLVKKTVNQDDIQTYHLFFADDKGSPGTDMTFFDFPNIPKGSHGTDEVYKTAFRVPNDQALDYWIKRFDKYGIEHEGIGLLFDKKIINFIDFDGQNYMLISDENNEGLESGTPWNDGPIPLEYAITGLGPIHLRVLQLDYFKAFLEKVFNMRELKRDGNLLLMEMGSGGNGASVILDHQPELAPGRQGYGTVHHVAFRVADREVLNKWYTHFNQVGLPNSGHVDRFFFESLYTRVSNGILFELATDGPGFMGDESYETLGEKLSLPPFLEEKRDYIESVVRPIDTVRSNKTFEKEYL